MAEPGHRWMRNLPNETPIQRLCIPGTHDSVSRDGFGAVYQDWTLEQQLLAGIRFLDIRANHFSDCFVVHQRDDEEHVWFNQVRDECVQFLVENPSEFLLMSVRTQGWGDNCTRSFQDTLEAYIDDYNKYFYLNPKTPTVGEARGKIVLVRGFPGTIGIPWNGDYFVMKKEYDKLDIDMSRYCKIGQDMGISDSEKFEREWEKIEQLFNQARNDPDNQKFFVSYLCPAYKENPQIHNLSETVNNRVCRYFKSCNNNWGCIVPLDFPDPSTINVIYNTSLLRCDALGGRKCRLFNDQHGEYMFAPHYSHFDSQRRRVFTDRLRNASLQNEWIVQEIGSNEYQIFNTAQKEFLYASEHDPYDQDRRRVFTWREGTPLTEGRWKLEVTDSQDVRIFNTFHKEYLYADIFELSTMEGNRREVFTWRPGNPVAPGTWKLEVDQPHRPLKPRLATRFGPDDAISSVVKFETTL